MNSFFWFRRDLRLDDNAGLYRALREGKPVVPVFIFDTEILSKLGEKSDRRLVFIHRQLERLDAELQQYGSGLSVFHGKPEEVWKDLAGKTGMHSVYTNEDYEPYAIARDERVKSILHETGIEFHSCKDQVIFSRDEVVKDNGEAYTVYTPYMNRWRRQLTDNNLESYPVKKYAGNFAKDFPKTGIPALDAIGFRDMQISFPSVSISPEFLQRYADERDFPAKPSTSGISVHLRFGTVSIRGLFRFAQAYSRTWTNELIWREFFMQILYHFPHVAERSFRPEYDRIRWENNESYFRAWCEGRTGYPMVDAGMRELNATGHMHNRVRMVTASFLAKHLFIDWRWGESYFAKHLLDFDLSANNGNWQWAAGCGTDAAPYFRIFNPAEQLRKFDPQLVYVKKWVPEFGSPDYPRPIVDHRLARERCLAGYKKGLGK